MKASNGSIRCSKLIKWVKAIGVIGAIVAVIVLYSNYLEGTFTIDAALVERLERVPIEEKAENLLSIGFLPSQNKRLWPGYSHCYDETMLYLHPAYEETNKPVPGVEYIVVYYKPVATWEGEPIVQAHYSRTPLSDALRDFGLPAEESARFGECTSTVQLEFPSYLIYMRDYGPERSWSQIEPAIEQLVSVLEQP